MIILSIGSNLMSEWGNPIKTLHRSIEELAKESVGIIKISSPYFSAPMTLTNNNDRTYVPSYNKKTQNYDLPKYHYINMCLIIATHKKPDQLLYNLKQIENAAGRRSDKRWASRVLDMDLICYHDVIIGKQVEKTGKNDTGFIPLCLPHPGIAKRAFVLAPIIEIAPTWHHPITGNTAKQMLNVLK